MTKEQRAALEKVRQAIHKAAPNAEECINYGVPAFRLDGMVFARFGAAKKHCSYFPMSGSIVAAFTKELKGYETTKGSIHFSVDKPLPPSLIRKLVKARLGEISARKTKK